MMKKKLFQESHNNKIILLFIIYELYHLHMKYIRKHFLDRWVAGYKYQNLKLESHTINAIYMNCKWYEVCERCIRKDTKGCEDGLH